MITSGYKTMLHEKDEDFPNPFQRKLGLLGGLLNTVLSGLYTDLLTEPHVNSPKPEYESCDQELYLEVHG